MTSYRTVFFVSDRTGITAENLGYSLISQFEKIKFKTITLPYIDNLDKAAAAKEKINTQAVTDSQRPLVFSTIIDEKIRTLLNNSNGFFIDLFGSFINTLEAELSEKSSHILGKVHGMSDVDNYNTRIEAINYAFSYDDGGKTKGYDKADVILVGVSRSGKTPTCLYLALMFGIRAANYPITDEDLHKHSYPEFLNQFRSKIVGLTIAPERLQAIRKQRRPNSQYSKLEQCQKEIQMVESLFKSMAIPFINSTSRSIEEIATQIMVLLGIERRLRP